VFSIPAIKEYIMSVQGSIILKNSALAHQYFKNILITDVPLEQRSKLECIHELILIGLINETENNLRFFNVMNKEDFALINAFNNIQKQYIMATDVKCPNLSKNLLKNVISTKKLLAISSVENNRNLKQGMPLIKSNTIAIKTLPLSNSENNRNTKKAISFIKTKKTSWDIGASFRSKFNNDFLKRANCNRIFVLPENRQLLDYADIGQAAHKELLTGR